MQLVVCNITMHGMESMDRILNQANHAVKSAVGRMHLQNAANGTHGRVVVKPGYRKADTLYCSKCSFQVLTICGLSAVKKSVHQAINCNRLVSDSG